MQPANFPRTQACLSARQFLTLPRHDVNALYVHVPFCLLKCAYCDFYSLPGMSALAMEDYVHSVLREADAWATYMQRSNSAFSTVFMGGGTPTALPLPLMRRFLGGLRQALPVAADAEWTIEANPATVDQSYCQMLLEGGVNRLSLGAQSLVDRELKELGRIHNAAAVMQTVHDAASAGFARISVDLMYSLPGQTLATWQYSLEELLRLGIRHLSCYCLTVEEDTPLWRQVQAGEIARADEGEERQFMQFTRQWLRERGMPPYELSNYAAPGQECRHNLVYWRGGNYIGLGPAAASHISGIRWRNAPDVAAYSQCLHGGRPTPLVDVEILDRAERASELVMLMLRTAGGLSWRQLREIAGNQPHHDLDKKALPQMKLLGLVSECSEGVQLTEQGVYVADHVISELVRELS